jgi:hypothetical protein
VVLKLKHHLINMAEGDVLNHALSASVTKKRREGTRITGFGLAGNGTLNKMEWKISA